LQNAGESTITSFDFYEPWEQLISFQALIPFNLTDQRLPVLIYIFTLLLAFILVFVSIKAMQSRAILIVALILFVLYFILPNNFSQGGYLSIRLLLCVFVFFAAFIGLNLDFKYAVLFTPVVIVIN